ncbi:MAG: hypothetical protein EWV53_02655 [Microcystis panniformis Mp_MB_F_20051200_S9]|uniref:Uncharacterized protein n=1 Tax=Microcystis panniformis Mp_MB_F_20051200_S9 TaxID=2486223 RepID=A0A552Q9F5_9CHRO|nr:MAG: hypothetical protein EWV43_07090 [Microcystis panniformis Mp_MB_F_20080800_S26D]TRV51515.1 MAG: hypothetical protein EWV87_06400 [Microcystis panniformis Mp_GB_SS_20050300_S99]TRV54923.1 MAG: hypothetical protein EWV42_02975 [Microcystis panniformis Mp_GB_SS_20050300_S99D]TRV56437.1 MAG: hypothetical protein EWV69_17955 [Microcystis panniformis Mp_MB_F_20080800_S26]TRV65843.1 MAG: hypothetical protein EWV53_02655 [Microcystis panniformis Mp_MB_F_20051200_S9]TRV66828.1 MAG: hypothetical
MLETLLIPSTAQVMAFVNGEVQLYGHPQKFIYLRIGNSPTSKIIEILRDNFLIIIKFYNSETESMLILS